MKRERELGDGPVNFHSNKGVGFIPIGARNIICTYEIEEEEA